MNKKLQLVLFVAVLLIVGYGAYLVFINLNKATTQTSSLIITNFEECVANGNPVMESYPRQCRYRDKIFVESVGNELEKTNLIRITSPRPNQTISSPLVIKGQASGSWFFEASFPIFLTDWDGKIIAQGVAQAKGDWMTTEFVPFEATIDFTVDKNIYSNRGSLILKKDNPSGLSQNDDALEIPIVFARINPGDNNTSGVSGYIHIGPICPVEKYPSDPNCADGPFANATVDVTVKSSGVLVSSVKSDVNGNFRTNLSPGTYLIKTRAPNNSILPSCGQKETVVLVNKFTNLDISCDTGIR